MGRFYGWLYNFAVIGCRLALLGILAKTIPLAFRAGVFFAADGTSHLSGLAAYLAYNLYYWKNQLGDWFLYRLPWILDCFGVILSATIGLFAVKAKTQLNEKGAY